MHKRKEIRLKNYDYSTPGAYFVTLCSENHINYFWKNDFNLSSFEWKWVGANCVRPLNLPLNEVGEILRNELEIWNKTYEGVQIYSYVIMANHVHVMVIIDEDKGRSQNAPTISRMVKQFKGSVTKKIGKSIWQKSFMEHVVRDKDDFKVRMEYIFKNPLHFENDIH